MPSIRNRVPYEVSLFARDAGSGRPLTNIFYLRNNVQSVAPPAYGAAIAGASDLATLLTAFQTVWGTSVAPLLNQNFKGSALTARAIIGKRYGSPLLPITSLIAGANTQITTGSPHGFTTGKTVSVTGITTPTGLNAQWVVTVIDSFNFTLNGGLSAGAWSGDGQVQIVKGPLQFLYDDVVTIADGNNGTQTSDALPLYCTASVRRINAGAGRNFRSRLSFSPISEGDSVDGGFTTAAKTAWSTALGALVGTFNNGGSDATSKFSVHVAVSKAKAFSVPSPFAQSDSWCKDVSSMILQRNTGSLIRRKPRLTSIIT